MDLAPEQLRSIASSYRLSQVVYTLALLGIPDALRAGALTAREVAGRVDADPPRMSRLLRAAASAGNHPRGRRELRAERFFPPAVLGRR
jgi:hypothetical protein